MIFTINSLFTGRGCVTGAIIGRVCLGAGKSCAIAWLFCSTTGAELVSTTSLGILMDSGLGSVLAIGAGCKSPADTGATLEGPSIARGVLSVAGLF